MSEYDECLTHEGALRLARIINDYWLKRGFVARAQPYAFTFDHERGLQYGITSRMVGGMPTERLAPERTAA
jgi:hypothetical protein